MSFNTNYPRTRAEDSEPIIRKQHRFDGGQVSDSEPNLIPKNSVALLENARGHSSSIRGRRGSTLFSEAVLPSEDIDEIAVHSPDDTQEITIGSDELAVDSVGSRITFSLDGTELVGIIYRYTPDADLTGNLQNFSVKLETAVPVARQVDTVHTDATGVTVRFGINASFSDISINVRYYLIGNTIYAREQKSTSWVEYTVDGTTQPLNSISRFVRIYDNIVLFNLSGIYVLNDINKTHYAYRVNTDTPRLKVNKNAISDSILSKSAYRYAYSYTRMREQYAENRLEEISYIECETPPYYVGSSDESVKERYESEFGTETRSYTPDDENNISTLIESELGSLDSFCYEYYITESATTAKFWTDKASSTTDYFIRIDFNGVLKDMYVDFSLVTSVSDVAKEINNFCILNVDPSIVCKLMSSNKFVIYSSRKEDYVEITSGGTENIMDSALIGYTVRREPMGTDVSYLSYPQRDRDLTGVTHYSLYRTKDIFSADKFDTDSRRQNSKNKLGWVDDVPVVKMFEATFTDSTTFTVTDGSYSVNDILDKISFSSDGSTDTDDEREIERVEKDDYLDTYTYTLKTAIVKLTTPGVLYGTIGAKKSSVGTVSSSTVTLSATNTPMIPADGIDSVGGLLFWWDGSTSICTGYTIGNGVVTTLTILDDQDRTAERFTYLPTYRSYKDTLNDNILDEYLNTFPLRSAGYRPLPDTSIAVYLNGSIIAARFRYSDIYNSDVTEFKQMGFYRVAGQTNNKLHNGITDMVEVGGVVSVFTPTETYAIDLRNNYVRTTEYGEAYTIISNPDLISKGVGVPQPDRWCRTNSNSILVLTSEPALREFTGLSYKNNLADGKVQTSYLDNMSNTFVMAFDNSMGLLMWGINNA